jgi:hypothetical protein
MVRMEIDCAGLCCNSRGIFELQKDPTSNIVIPELALLVLTGGSAAEFGLRKISGAAALTCAGTKLS